jgi:hypothetical protein
MLPCALPCPALPYCPPLQQSLRTLAKAADLISIGDVANASVRRANNWGLMPFGALVGSVMPSAYMRGQRVTFNEYEQVGGCWQGRKGAAGMLWQLWPRGCPLAEALVWGKGRRLMLYMHVTDNRIVLVVQQLLLTSAACTYLLDSCTNAAELHALQLLVWQLQPRQQAEAAAGGAVVRDGCG